MGDEEFPDLGVASEDAVAHFQYLVKQPGFPEVCAQLSTLHGLEFVRAAAIGVGALTGAKMVIVGRRSTFSQQVKTVANIIDGEATDNFTYDLADTPCEDVMDDSLCCFANNVCELYPKDHLLIDAGVKGYVGAALIDENERPVGVINCCFDTPVPNTEFTMRLLRWVQPRISSEILMREKLQQLEVATELASDGLWDYDVKADSIEMSDRLRKTLGLSAQHKYTACDSLDPYIHKDDLKRLRQVTFDSANSDDPLRAKETNIRLFTASGEYVWFKARLGSFVDENGDLERSIGFLTQVEDLVKARQAADQANQVKSAFLSMVSHEIRTPMNGILGAAELLARNPHEADAQNLINIIRHSGSGLMDLLNNILDLTKLEAGKIELESTTFNLREKIDAVLSIHALKAREKGIRFVSRIDLDEDDTRAGDPYRLSQVIHNIVSNAVKFTDTGEVRLKASVDTVGRQSGVRLVVSDSGIGIPRTKRELIFEPFQQSDSSTSRSYGGTGLGLSIVAGIIDVVGGQIDVRDSSDGGAEFEVFFPCERVEQVLEDEETRENEYSELADKRILIAEDHDVNRKLLHLLLHAEVKEMVFAANGLEAVTAFKEREFDMVLMDINMPVMDGKEALRQMRRYERDAKKQPKPILAVTADALGDREDQLRAEGFSDLVSKPFTRQSLLDTMVRHYRIETASGKSGAA